MNLIYIILFHVMSILHEPQICKCNFIVLILDFLHYTFIIIIIICLFVYLRKGNWQEEN